MPVVVLNACQSGAIGKSLEAAIATRLLQEGTASVVAMAYNVYAVAAAEFMAALPAATEHVGPVGPLVRYEENWAGNEVAYCVAYAYS